MCESSKSSLLKCVHNEEVRRLTQLLIVIVVPFNAEQSKAKQNMGFQIAVILHLLTKFPLVRCSSRLAFSVP